MPILADDTAHEVFQKVVVAAEMTLVRALPQLIAGTAASVPLDLKAGSYFSGRKPEDGRIDWTKSARDVYNLIRAVAPPYPGAFTEIGGEHVIISRARTLEEGDVYVPHQSAGSIVRRGETIAIVCGDSRWLELLTLVAGGQLLHGEAARQWLQRKMTT